MTRGIHIYEGRIVVRAVNISIKRLPAGKSQSAKQPIFYMRHLPSEVIDFFKKQTFVIVSTIDDDGSPHNSCKDIIRISRDGRIYLLDLYFRKTHANLQKNPNMCVAQVDEHNFSGYCLKGKGNAVKITRLNPQINKIWQKKITARITNRIIRNIQGQKGHDAHPESQLPRPEHMIIMDVEEIIDLTPGHLRESTA
jgi:predicted pyridoxine 5'-phosphate oxidase superfamily flavin-nucleotide-binding protein